MLQAKVAMSELHYKQQTITEKLCLQKSYVIKSYVIKLHEVYNKNIKFRYDSC